MDCLCITYNATLCDKVCHGLAVGWWFSKGVPVSSSGYYCKAGCSVHRINLDILSLPGWLECTI